ncbi:hypothetical protein OK015_21635 [Mycobacterium sp. Aquia_216]|nr:hypothetical protein [Mycobacterium sp. Aquia_216]WAJ43758.1 hypothetical protein OK015_21635 [Mycobacterium sp. Aquia_216]
MPTSPAFGAQGNEMGAFADAVDTLLNGPMIEAADVTEAMVYLCGQSGR